MVLAALALAAFLLYRRTKKHEDEPLAVRASWITACEPRELSAVGMSLRRHAELHPWIWLQCLVCFMKSTHYLASLQPWSGPFTHEAGLSHMATQINVSLPVHCAG